MTSLNDNINELHMAFCDVTDRRLPMNPAFERWWYEAIKFGITPEMVVGVMQSRMRREYATAGMRIHCLSLKHCIGDEERLAQFVDESAQIEAAKRKKVFAPGKAEVLRATQRPDEPVEQPARHIGEVFAQMRKQVG